ncbi:MAG: 4-hydroxy-tetrahydrodipicolinate synthase [Candidatus Micrarchaeia archaeon]
MGKHDFFGVHTPLVTPFKDDLSYDEEGFRKLCRHFIDNVKVQGLVPCGTTGESPTLTDEEKKRVIEITIEEAAGKVPVMAGAGSNSTHHAIRATRTAEKLGANAVLIVGPYYNKPNQKGLLAHYKVIAENTSLPIFIYNIPGRTSRNIEPETIIKLAKEVDNIAGLKDACADLNQTMKIISATKDLKKEGNPFYVLSGEDALTFSIMALGGHGAISATSHVVGEEQIQMWQKISSGDLKGAREIHFKILPMMKTLFIESNPSPVKHALKLMNLPSGKVRIPLVELSKESKDTVRQALFDLGKIKG